MYQLGGIAHRRVIGGGGVGEPECTSRRGWAIDYDHGFPFGIMSGNDSSRLRRHRQISLAELVTEMCAFGWWIGSEIGFLTQAEERSAKNSGVLAGCGKTYLLMKSL